MKSLKDLCASRVCWDILPDIIRNSLERKAKKKHEEKFSICLKDISCFRNDYVQCLCPHFPSGSMNISSPAIDLDIRLCIMTSDSRALFYIRQNNYERNKNNPSD